MAKRPDVALIVETSIHYGRQILRGITRYLRSHQSWSVFLEQRELWTAPPAWLRKWRGGGGIFRQATPGAGGVGGRAEGRAGGFKEFGDPGWGRRRLSRLPPVAGG